MLGWMILFGLMTLFGAVMILSSPTMAWLFLGSMFGTLFVVGLLTRVMRGRAW